MTGIPTDADKFYRSVYSIELAFVPAGAKSEDDKIDLSRAVESMEITKNYEGTTLPSYRFLLKAPRDDLWPVALGFRGAKLVLTVRRFEQGGNSAENHTDPLDVPIDNARLKIMDLNSPASDRVLTACVIDALPETPLGVMRKVHNRTFHACRLDWAVAALVSDSRPTDGYKFYMTPPDNQREFESLLLPPGNLVECVEHLDQQHGLYEGRVLQFFDLARGYIMGSNHFLAAALPKDMPTGIVEYAPASLDGAIFTAGCAKDPDNAAFRLRTLTRPDFPLREASQREDDGTDAKLMTNSQETGVSQTECRDLDVAPGPAGEDKGRERIYWNAYDNPMAPSRLKRARYETLVPMTLQFQNHDMAFWDPAREYKFVSSEGVGDVLEGSWRLAASRETFRRSAMGEDVSVATGVALLRPAGSPKAGAT